MITVEIEPGLDFPSGLLEGAARAALDLSGASEADLSVLLSDNAHIQVLNRDFLGRDAPTDVIAFPADEADPETGRRYLGDVIVSLPRAIEQAVERGHAVQAEVQLLVVHGVLHLLGHDHAGAEEKKRMWAAQAGVLEHLGLSPSIVKDENGS